MTPENIIFVNEVIEIIDVVAGIPENDAGVTVIADGVPCNYVAVGPPEVDTVAVTRHIVLVVAEVIPYDIVAVRTGEIDAGVLVVGNGVACNGIAFRKVEIDAVVVIVADYVVCDSVIV